MNPSQSPLTESPPRDHGGGLDAAVARWGGARDDWVDLSTGVNPCPYPLPNLSAGLWTALPDRAAFGAIEAAARGFWEVPDGLGLLPVPGASAAIARLPALRPAGTALIPGPTYNEHAAAFRSAGWAVVDVLPPGRPAEATVLVHPNNPDGRIRTAADLPPEGLLVLDESFCDVMPGRSLLPLAETRPGTLVLKSFGKFWGLAGLRLGFVIGPPVLIAALREMIGPWAVSGPALAIGTAALSDPEWAVAIRRRLAADAARLDRIIAPFARTAPRGTDLFRLYEMDDAETMWNRLGQARILTRVFPYSRHWLRVGLPGSDAAWVRLEQALR